MADKKFSEFTLKPTPTTGDEIVGTSGADNIRIPVDAFATGAEGDKANTAVQTVAGTAPITSTGTTAKTIGITPATDVAPGSMSAADKAKLDAITGTNTGNNSGDVTVSNTATIDLTLTGQALSADVNTGSLDETHLDVSVNASLDKADSALQTEVANDGIPRSRRMIAGVASWIQAKLSELLDVAATPPTNGQVLTYDDTLNVWYPATPTGGGHLIQDEGGTPLTPRAKLNFIGATVSATDNPGNDSTDITVTGGGGGGSGDVVGPVSSTDNAIARYDGATGKFIQNSGITIADGASGTLSGTNTGDQTITLTGDVTGSGTGSFAATIAAAAVTLAKMANVATGSVFYRKTAGTGAPEVQTLATLKTDLGLTGTNSGDQTITLTGDVTGSGTGSFAATIANAAVTLAKMANMATGSVFYRKTAGSGAPEVQTLATLKTDLGLTGTNSGDQTSIVGITGTIAEFNTACTDADFATGGGSATGSNTGDQTITLTGDVTGSGSGSFAATIANAAVTLAKMANMATNSVFYRKTAGSGAPEVQTLDTLKNDLGLTGTNSGDQTSIVGITGTKAQYDTSATDGNFTWDGDPVSVLTNDAGYMTDVVNDTTPTLGGNLDANQKTISNAVRVAIEGQTATYTSTPAGLLEFTGIHEIDYASATMPSAVKMDQTYSLRQAGFPFGMGALFDSLGLIIKNVTGIAANIGPYHTVRAQTKIQADNAAITANGHVEFIASPIYEGIGTGTVTSSSNAGYSSTHTINPGATITTRSGFVAATGTVTGTLTNYVGFNSSIGTGTNRTHGLFGGSPATGNWLFYQGDNYTRRYQGSCVRHLSAVSGATNYTIQVTDELITALSGSTGTFTLPSKAELTTAPNYTAANMDGWTCTVKNNRAGNLVVSAGATITFNNATRATIAAGQDRTFTYYSTGDLWV